MTYDRLLVRPRLPRPAALASALRRMLALHRQRARLARLDDHILRDIGLSRAEAEAEATRAPWDVPSHWRG